MARTSKTTTKRFKSVGDIFCELAEMLRPPERLSVSDAAEKYRYVNNPGAYVGPWKNETTPYLAEVMDTLRAAPPRMIVVQTNDYIRLMLSRPSSSHLAGFPALNFSSAVCVRVKI